MKKPVRSILTDIEGTTSSLAFVNETLFPYAREHLPAYVEAHRDELGALLEEVRALEPGDVTATLLRWMDEDKKATPLKTLQGLIWAQGYADGALIGHVYPDAAAALRAWHASGFRLYVYSSGSIAAQKLIFGKSDQGNLALLFRGWFDTTSGSKLAAESYRAIAPKIARTPDEVLFLSDNPTEIAAAAAAGMRTQLVDRTGKTPGGVTSFADITP
jgi:enolase-phosphatase E1